MPVSVSRKLQWLLTFVSATAVGCHRPPHHPATYEDVVGAYERYRHEGAAEIAIDDALELGRDGVVFVDVRGPDERAVSWIPGSIIRDELEERLRDRDGSEPDPLVVAYCTIGYRSGKYVRSLTQRGIRAANLHGSILGWVHQGHPVVDSLGVTKRLHVYGRRWNLAPEGYESVW